MDDESTVFTEFEYHEEKTTKMTIKEKILKDKADAFKDGNKEIKDLLGVILSEAERHPDIKDQKNPTDEDMLMVIKKAISNARLCADENTALYLEANYMPEKLSNEDLTDVIWMYCKNNNITEKKQMGLVMKYLKDNYSGEYDGKQASEIISSILQ